MIDILLHRRVGFNASGGFVAAMALLLLASPAQAEPTNKWQTLCPGVRYLHRTTAEPLSVHVVVADLEAPGIGVEVTPHEHRWRSTSQYGRVMGAVAAINGGFWSMIDKRAEGLVMHRGRRWPGARDDEFFGFFAVDKQDRAVISPKRHVARRIGNLREAISGLQLIVWQGRVHKEARCYDGGCRFRHPRTAVGVSRDRRKVFLAVVDGRRRHSRGMTLSQLGRLLIELGAWQAINLDGGGSAAMYLATKKGLINRPADKRERDVLNHIGVYWRPTPAQLKAIAEADQKRKAAARKPAAKANKDPNKPVLTKPPKPTTAGVPTGVRRWLQLGLHELVTPRNLLIALPLLGFLVFLGFRFRRRRDNSG